MNISVEELNALAKEHFQPDDMITIVVGDKSIILEGLQTLGRPIIEADKLGVPL